MEKICVLNLSGIFSIPAVTAVRSYFDLNTLLNGMERFVVIWLSWAAVLMSKNTRDVGTSWQHIFKIFQVENLFFKKSNALPIQRPVFLMKLVQKLNHFLMHSSWFSSHFLEKATLLFPQAEVWNRPTFHIGKTHKKFCRFPRILSIERVQNRA